MVGNNIQNNYMLNQISVPLQFADQIVSARETSRSDNGNPIIEIATYSDTDVYECYIRGFESRIVMRRTRDDWINITQVFKIAEFTKTRRTKVLEKESPGMQHEKVQGGYGRFQGTWIPLDAAKYITNKYNISDPVVSTILFFELNPNNPPPRRRKNSLLRKSSPGTKITSPSSYNKTPKRKNYGHSTKKKKITDIPANIADPSPLRNVAFQTPMQNGLNSVGPEDHLIFNQNGNDILPTMKNNLNNRNIQSGTNNFHISSSTYSATQKPLQFYSVPTNHGDNLSTRNQYTNFAQVSGNKNIVGMNNNYYKNLNISHNKNQGQIEQPQQQQQAYHEFPVVNTNKDKEETSPMQMVNKSVNNIPNKIYRGRSQHPESLEQYDNGANSYTKKYNIKVPNSNKNHNITHSNGSTTEMFSSSENQTPPSSHSNTDDDNDGNAGTLNADQYREALLQVLATEKITDETEKLISKLYYQPPTFDINFLIDDQGHTALHWATALANMPLIKLLVHLEANLTIHNQLGVNCITKAVFYNNCYTLNAFAEIISLLKVCLITPDANGRLPIHYLVELSVNPTKNQEIISYYMNTILNYISQESQELLRSCLDYRDNMGNSVLHLAALNLNLALWNKFSSLGASMSIINRDGQTPIVILGKYNMVPPSINPPLNTIIEHRGPEQTFQSNVPDEHELEDNNTIQSCIDKNVAIDTKIPSNKKKKKINDSIITSKIESSSKYTAKEASKTNSGVDTANNSININNMLDDINSLDAMVTSSALRDTNFSTLSTLQQSPVIHKKGLVDLQNSLIINSPKFNSDSKELKSPKVKVSFPISIRSDTILPNSNLSKLLFKLKEAGSIFTSSLISTADRLTSDINITEMRIKETIERIKLLNAQEEEVMKTLVDRDLKSLGVITPHSLNEKIADLGSEISMGKEKCVQYAEKSQALKLATLVQDEESFLDSDVVSSPVGSSSSNGRSNARRLLVDLTLLQLKRRSTIDNITKIRVQLNSTEKLNKYRCLIGMTTDDIETKLDAIENDLQANA